jgi:hypothetical protein
MGFIGNAFLSKGKEKKPFFLRTFHDLELVGIVSFTNELDLAIEKFDDTTHNITAKLKQVDPSADISSFSDGVHEVRKTADTAADYVYGGDAIRILLVVLGFQFVLATIAIAITAAIWKKSTVAKLMVLMCFMTAFFLGWSYAGTFPHFEFFCSKFVVIFLLFSQQIFFFSSFVFFQLIFQLRKSWALCATK